MQPIPHKMREAMAADPFYAQCVIGVDCSGRIEWHHVWIYAGKQITAPWAIVPACTKHHAMAHNRRIKAMFEHASLQRATATDVAPYPRRNWEKTRVVVAERAAKYARTDQQNKALHLYFKHVADSLNDGGFTVQLVLREKVDIDWNPRLVKELLWRTAQRAVLGKSSTTELEKHEDIDLVYSHLNRHFSEKFGLHVPFPSKPPGYYEQAPLKNDNGTGSADNSTG